MKKNELSKNSFLKVGTMAGVLLGGVISANAATSIGWNYVNPGANPASPVAPTAIAGVGPYAQANWNNHVGNGQAPGDTPLTGLIDSNGVTTSAEVVSWTAAGTPNSWHHGQASDPLDGNIDLMDDFNNRDVTITFGNIPYANYSVVIYYGNNEPVDGAALAMSTLSAGALSRVISTGNSDTAGYHSVGFIEGTDADTTAKSNYTVFHGLSSSTLVVSMLNGVDGSTNLNNGIAAIQIVEAQAIPEPSTALFVGLGALLLLRRKR